MINDLVVEVHAFEPAVGITREHPADRADDGAGGNDDRRSSLSDPTTSTTLPPTQTEWELIQVDPEVSDYAAAIATRPELVELINSDDLVTAFVPTNTALDDVPDWEQIVADEAAFDSLVRSHLITGALTAEQIFAGTAAPTTAHAQR